MEIVSLENYSQFETVRVLDSPLSVKACQALGVLPKSLLYK